MSRIKQAGLVLSGVCVGVMISLTMATSANRELAGNSLPVDEVRNLADVFNSIKQHYVEPVDDKKLIRDAISGMVSGLDPHSAYLDEEAFRDMQISIKGEFGGLGIEVTMEDGLDKVVSPIEDTPAFRAGGKAGDLLTNHVAVTKAYTDCKARQQGLAEHARQIKAARDESLRQGSGI